MRAYVLRRLLLFIPTLLAVSVLIFVLMHILPGDIAHMILVGSSGDTSASMASDIAKLRAQLGLDRPLYVQYGDWFWHLLRLDMGTSLWSSQPVAKEISRRLPVTLELAAITLSLNILAAFFFGVVSAVRRGTMLDSAIRVFAIGGLAMPTFWVGTLFLIGAATLANWSTPVGFTALWTDPRENLAQILPPALILAYYQSAMLTRVVRSSMLEVLRQDYIRTAHAKGLLAAVVLRRHALANALLPTITLAGVQCGQLIAGAVLMERVFALPGIGSLIVESILARDWVLTQALIVLIALFVLCINLVTDLLYAWVDPRVKYG